MRKSLLLVLAVFLSTGVAYAQVQLEKFKPKQMERVEPTKPEKMEIPTIEVLSPNGGETWETGKRYTIRWKSKGVKGNVKIMLKYEYGPGRAVRYKITQSTPNTGNYSFTLPTDIIYEGLQFRVHVIALDERVRDESDRRFNITTKKGGPTFDIIDIPGGK